MQFFFETTPLNQFLSVKDRELDDTTIDELLEIETSPGCKLITPQLIAFFEYLMWKLPRDVMTHEDKQA